MKVECARTKTDQSEAMHVSYVPLINEEVNLRFIFKVS